MEANARTVYIGGNTITTDKVMKERDPYDFYATGKDTLYAYFRAYRVPHRNILDPSAGLGVWGSVLRDVYTHTEYLCGNDIQEHMVSVDSAFMYDTWLTSDFLRWPNTFGRPDGEPLGFDLIATNPPYKYAEEFFWKSYDLVAPSGSIVFLLRLGFLASERRYKTMWSVGYAPTSVTVCNTRPSFTGDGKTYPGDFAFFRWDVDQHKKCIETNTIQYLMHKRELYG